MSPEIDLGSCSDFQGPAFFFSFFSFLSFFLLHGGAGDSYLAHSEMEQHSSEQNHESRVS